MKALFLIFMAAILSFQCVPFADANTIAYTYDHAGRIIGVDYGNERTISYSYDDAGNLLQRVVTTKITLADAIISLQVLANIVPASAVYREADVNGDRRIGIEEVVYVLQKISGIR